VEEFYATSNCESDPFRYRIDPLEQASILRQLEQRGSRVVAIFHSHPQGDAFPSSRDKELAYYPEAAYLILSLRNWDYPELRGFSIREGKVEEIRVRLLSSGSSSCGRREPGDEA